MAYPRSRAIEIEQGTRSFEIPLRPLSKMQPGATKHRRRPESSTGVPSKPGVGLLGWSADRRGITVAQIRSRGAHNVR